MTCNSTSSSADNTRAPFTSEEPISIFGASRGSGGTLKACPPLMPFDFTREGMSDRRRADAQPKHLFTGLTFDTHEVWFHPAGDDYVRRCHVFDAMQDVDFMEAFPVMDAVRITLEYARAERMMRDREIAALKEAGNA